MEISGDVAQLGERRLCKPEVAGSIPVFSTSFVGPVFSRLRFGLGASRRIRYSVQRLLVSSIDRVASLRHGQEAL